eukprot:4739918-Pyramimonas_sp.AAC.1
MAQFSCTGLLSLSTGHPDFDNFRAWDRTPDTWNRRAGTKDQERNGDPVSQEPGTGDLQGSRAGKKPETAGTGDQDPGSGDWGQGTGDWGSGTVNQAAGNRGQGAENWDRGPREGSRGLGTRGPGTWS